MGFLYEIGVYSTNSSKMIGNIPAILNFNRLCLKLNRFIWTNCRFSRTWDLGPVWILPKVDMPNSVTCFYQMPIFEWYVIWCGSKTKYHKYTFVEYMITILDSIRNLIGGATWLFKWPRESSLWIYIYTHTHTHKESGLLRPLGWICWPSRTSCVFHILEEVS